jgi:hypothetical protein
VRRHTKTKVHALLYYLRTMMKSVAAVAALCFASSVQAQADKSLFTFTDLVDIEGNPKSLAP